MLFLKLDNKNTCPSNGIKCCIRKRYVTNRKIQNIYLYFYWINFTENVCDQKLRKIVYNQLRSPGYVRLIKVKLNLDAINSMSMSMLLSNTTNLA